MHEPEQMQDPGHDLVPVQEELAQESDPFLPRINSKARSLTSVIFALTGCWMIVTHPDRFWEGLLLGFVGAGVVGPEILEGFTRMRR